MRYFHFQLGCTWVGIGFLYLGRTPWLAGVLWFLAAGMAFLNAWETRHTGSEPRE